MKGVRRRIRWAISGTRGIPVVGGLVRQAFRFGAARAARRLAATPGVRSVYVRHGHPSSATFFPGMSDLDLTLVLHDAAAESPAAVARVAATIERISRLHPYAHSSDARLTTAPELARLTRDYESPFTLLVTPDDWRLVGGEESRTERARTFPASRVPRHPEFNRWWREVLPRHALRLAPLPEARNVRPFVRGAVKQRLHFLAARGRSLPGGRGYVEDAVFAAAFADDAATRAVVEDARRKSFRVRDPNACAAALFHAALRGAESFFDETHDDAILGGVAPEREPARHARAAAAIARSLESCPGLDSFLAGALVYPIPFVAPAFHQADLLVPDGTSAERIGEIIASLRTLGGREATADGGVEFAVSLVPAKAAAAPLAWLGSPYPFLREHVARFGAAILGASMPDLGATSAPALREWIRDWLPCHLFTLNRRAEHASRTVNGVQLGAIRLFLETGEIVTEAGALEARGAAPPRNSTQAWLTREYARVESLISESHALPA